MSKPALRVGPSTANVSGLCLSLCGNSLASNPFLCCLTGCSASTCPPLSCLSSRGCLHAFFIHPRPLLPPLLLHSAPSSALFISPASVFHLLSVSPPTVLLSRRTVLRPRSSPSSPPGRKNKQASTCSHGILMTSITLASSPAKGQAARGGGEGPLSALVTRSLNRGQQGSFEGLSKHLLEPQVNYFFLCNSILCILLQLK